MSRSIPSLRRVVFSLVLIASVAVTSVAYQVGKAQANSQPDVVVSVDLSSPAATSHLAVGVSHIYNGLGISALDPAAQASAQTLLSQGVTYENRHIYGWGLRDPNPSPGTYDWSDLDSAVNELRKLGGTPVLTLCCSPGWMTALGHSTNGEPDYNAAPTPAHYGDYADLARLIAQRYRDITHFQVWNEVKGFNWSASAYTTFYNGIYDALKAVNPAIQVGGPYLPVQGGGTNGSGTDGDPIPSWQISFLEYWLANKHGADFLDLDYSVVDYNATPPTLDQIIAGTGRFEAIVGQVRTLPGYNNLPIWWAEDYCDANQGRLSYMPDNFQGACLASMLYHELRSGASVSLRWSPGGDSYEASGQSDIESLFTDAQRSGGGHPYPAYYAYQAIHDYFGPDVPIYTTTVSSTSVEALASATKTLLINQRGSQMSVELRNVIYTLSPYQVIVVDTPSASSATPLATTTTSTPSVSTSSATATGTSTSVPTSSATAPSHRHAQQPIHPHHNIWRHVGQGTVQGQGHIVVKALADVGRLDMARTNLTVLRLPEAQTVKQSKLQMNHISRRMPHSRRHRTRAPVGTGQATSREGRMGKREAPPPHQRGK